MPRSKSSDAPASAPKEYVDPGLAAALAKRDAIYEAARRKEAFDDENLRRRAAGEPLLTDERDPDAVAAFEGGEAARRAEQERVAARKAQRDQLASVYTTYQVSLPPVEGPVDDADEAETPTRKRGRSRRAGRE